VTSTFGSVRMDKEGHVTSNYGSNGYEIEGHVISTYLWLSWIG
jgi:hypothetical protein